MKKGSQPVELVPSEEPVEPMSDDLLSAVLVHELRQPLFAIKGLVQILAREQADPRYAEILDRVRYAEDLLANVAEHVRQPLGAESFDLAEVMRDVARMMSPRAEASGVRIELQGEPGGLRVAGRSTAARQVLINLVQNGMDATSEHGGEVVRLLVGREGSSALCVVEDTGAGIAPRVRATLGTPFVTTKPPGKGTGLGLYIAQKLVREHGGSLTFADPVHGGTRVEVRLPLVTGLTTGLAAGT